MLLPNSFVSSALAIFLFCGSSVGAPRPHSSALDRRQGSGSSTNGTSGSTTGGNATTAALEPVIPPQVDQNALSTLSLSTNVTLAWAGAVNSTDASASTRRLLKRDNGVFAQAAFNFTYPTVALDHSTYVSSVACSGGNLLTGTLTSQAYSFAKQQWTGAGHIVFVTSVDGCGADANNDYFLATSISFSDSDSTFTATGSSARYSDVANYMALAWGDVNPNVNVKRAINKRDMFEPSRLRRRCFLDLCFDDRESVTMTWDVSLEDILGVDNDAPWDHATKLIEFSSEGGEEDDSYEKGEVAEPDGHHKRSDMASLAERDGYSYGLAFYCVDCGFAGSATVWGELAASITDGITKAQVGLDSNFEITLQLGMEAYVKYEKEWEKELARIPLPFGFEIWEVISVGPYASISVSASASIEATGTLLAGVVATWDDISVVLDLHDPLNSGLHGLLPTFEPNIEVAGELGIEASLGLPVAVGVGIELDIFDDAISWSADASVVDTPSVVLEGKFEVSASVDSNGTIETDVNDGCYGIAWDIHFENTLQAVLEADDIGKLAYNILDPMESDPIAQGCIGYIDNGEDDPDQVNDSATGSGSGSGITGNGLNFAANGLSGGTAQPAVGGGTTSTSTSSSTSTLKPAVLAATQQSSSSTATSSSAATTQSPNALQATPNTSTQPSTSSSTSSSTAKSSSSSSTSSSSSVKSTSSSSTSSTSSTTSGAAKAAATSTSKTSSSSSSAKSSTPSSSGKTTASPTSAAKTSTTSTKSSSTTSTAPTCTPSQAIVNAKPPTGSTCKSVVNQASVAATLNVGKATTVGTVSLCAANCLNSTTCASFSYSAANSCQLYNKAVKNLGTTTKAGNPALTFYDKQCYAYSTCPK